MNDALYYFTHLFDTGGFPARWHCGSWNAFTGWFYILSNVGTWLAYFTIPALLLSFVRRRDDVPFSRLFLLFAAFIWACGTSHFMDAMMFWWPAYRLSGVVHFLTAVISWITIGALVKVIPQALTLKTPTQLERIIEERTRELAAANAQISEANALLKKYALDLERSNRELEQFATIASHDLQEPLRKMSMFSDRLSGLVPAEGQHYLNRLQNAADRMQALIKALLDFSRVNRKGLNLHEADLNEVLRTVLDDLQVSIRERRGAVIVGDLTVVQGNSHLLHQLFQNLISNALKYQHDNRPPIIRISGQRIVGPHGERFYEVCVKDNGLGIPSEHFQLIFEPFERLANQNGRDGVGMGLAICKKIMTRLQGTIEVESTVDQGSTFRLLFKLPNGEGPHVTSPMRGNQPLPEAEA